MTSLRSFFLTLYLHSFSFVLPLPLLQYPPNYRSQFQTENQAKSADRPILNVRDPTLNLQQYQQQGESLLRIDLCEALNCDFETSDSCYYQEGWGVHRPWNIANHRTAYPPGLPFLSTGGYHFVLATKSFEWDKFMLQSPLVLVPSPIILSFDYFQTGIKSRFMVCVDTDDDCPFVSPGSLRPLGQNLWETGQILVKPGSRRVMFIADNLDNFHYVALDNILVRDVDGQPLLTCYSYGFATQATHQPQLEGNTTLVLNTTEPGTLPFSNRNSTEDPSTFATSLPVDVNSTGSSAASPQSTAEPAVGNFTTNIASSLPDATQSPTQIVAPQATQAPIDAFTVENTTNGQIVIEPPIVTLPDNSSVEIDLGVFSLMFRMTQGNKLEIRFTFNSSIADMLHLFGLRQGSNATAGPPELLSVPAETTSLASVDNETSIDAPPAKSTVEVTEVPQAPATTVSLVTSDASDNSTVAGSEIEPKGNVNVTEVQQLSGTTFIYETTINETTDAVYNTTGTAPVAVLSATNETAVTAAPVANGNLTTTTEYTRLNATGFSGVTSEPSQPFTASADSSGFELNATGLTSAVNTTLSFNVTVNSTGAFNTTELQEITDGNETSLNSTSSPENVDNASWSNTTETVVIDNTTSTNANESDGNATTASAYNNTDNVALLSVNSTEALALNVTGTAIESNSTQLQLRNESEATVEPQITGGNETSMNSTLTSETLNNTSSNVTSGTVVTENTTSIDASESDGNVTITSDFSLQHY